MRLASTILAFRTLGAAAFGGRPTLAFTQNQRTTKTFSLSSTARMAQPSQVPQAVLGRLAVGQLCSTNDAASNFKKCTELAIEAKKQGAAFLSLPGTSETRQNAQSLAGPIFTQYRQMAKDIGLWLSLGGFHEMCEEEPGKVYNTHAIVDAQGDVVATYRKLHLFDVDVDGGFMESRSTKRGEHALVVRGTPVGTVGVTTCYDVRFPELYCALREAGAHVLLVPSAFMPTTGAAHWEVLLRARAIETQCYVAAAAQYGSHNEKRSSWGHAMLVDPWGKVLADLGGDSSGVGVCDVSMEDINAVRLTKIRALDVAKAVIFVGSTNICTIKSKMPVQSHRRKDIIEIVVGGSGDRVKIVEYSKSAL